MFVFEVLFPPARACTWASHTVWWRLPWAAWKEGRGSGVFVSTSDFHVSQIPLVFNFFVSRTFLIFCGAGVTQNNGTPWRNNFTKPIQYNPPVWEALDDGLDFKGKDTGSLRHPAAGRGDLLWSGWDRGDVSLALRMRFLTLPLLGTKFQVSRIWLCDFWELPPNTDFQMI